MPAVETKEVALLKAELSKTELQIAAIERRKLITVISSGGPDAVLYVEPLDLGEKDPEGLVEVIEDYVAEEDFTQGFSNPKRGKRKTGQFLKRGPKGPFGWTHKIDTTVQDGVREWEELKRVIQTHTSRFNKVPEPIAYHHEVDDKGYIDLRNIHIEPSDVPVAVLENYKPLEDLKTKRVTLQNRLRELGEVIVTAPTDVEDAKVAEAQTKVFVCQEAGCVFTTKSSLGFSQHKGKYHKEG